METDDSADWKHQQACLEIELLKSVDLSTAEVGDTLTYTIDYRNHTGSNTT
ncbi:MAG: hypothetical protein H6765_02630 [Candidatus Peribacteria bacterium]|nr:MAG: hypothetical protein H6765_02630 [Candidatus Peribacteria bacterium]